MKKIIFLFVAVCLLWLGKMEGQSWLWGQQGNISKPASIEGWAVAADISGNGYLTGFYSGNTIVFGTDTLTAPAGTWGAYLVKFSPAGNVLWAKQGSSLSDGYGYSVATDLSGNIYMTGYFDDNIMFGTDTLRSLSGFSAFLVKYSLAGNVLWAEQDTASHGSAEGISVCTDKDNNIYVTGNFSNTVSFGAYTLNAGSYTTLFTVKYDSNGIVQWAKQVNDSLLSFCWGLGIAADNKDNIYVTGNFTGNPYFGTHRLTCTNSIGGEGDVFLVKYNAAGELMWAEQGVTYNQSLAQGYAVTTDKADNVFLTGTFRDSVSIGGRILATTFDYWQDLFLAKVDSNGNFIWVETAKLNDTTDWYGSAMSFDTNENLYLSCFGFSITGDPHNYKIVFGTDTFKTYIGPTGDGASLVLKLDTSGALICGSIVNGGGDDNNGIAADPSGNNIYFGGDLQNNDVIFGLDTLKEPSFGGWEYPFMAKWQPCDNVESAIPSIPGLPFLSVFPNPSTGVFNFQISNTEQGIMNIEVYNVMGELVETECLPERQGQAGIASLQSAPFTIDLRSKSNGVYFYRIIDENERAISEGKLMLQK